jgi:hypothetical protein
MLMSAGWFLLTGNVIVGVACLLAAVVAGLIDSNGDLED